MKKQNKKQKVKINKKLTLIIATAALVVLAGTFYGVMKVHYYNDAANQAGMVQIRELILLAVNNLKKDVPVEPKKGDLYFPESGLYLPNPKTPHKLTYAWYPGDEHSGAELSVSLAQAPGTTGLYSARNMEEMFNAVPKLQSCSRGVKISYQKLPLDTEPANKLKHTVSLQDGRVVYLYLEDTCPELEEVIDLLKNLQSY